MNTFIQIGCNIGQDDVQRFLTESECSYNVLLIDANPNCLDKCRESYKDLLNKHNIQFLHLAIVNDPSLSTIDIFIPNNDETSLFSSFSESHARTHSSQSCNKISSPACTLNKLFELHNLKQIAHLCIDTEGLCVDNLLAVDFNAVKIDNIVFEFIHSDGMLSHGGPKLDKLKTLLSEKGYSLQEIGYNILAQKNNNG